MFTRRSSPRRRHEWEAFLGLIPAIAASAGPAGILVRCRRTVLQWHTDLIRREDFERAGTAEPATDLDYALARLVQEGTIVPIAAQPHCFRTAARTPANQESAYAGDNTAALKTAVIEEQCGRNREMQAMQALLASGHVSSRRAAWYLKHLKALAATYAAQWLELECAIGREAAEEARRDMEALAADRESQLRLSFVEVVTPREPQEDGHAEN